MRHYRVFSPVGLMRTNLAASSHLGTPGFLQTFSALHSDRILCLAASDPLVVTPSGFYTPAYRPPSPAPATPVLSPLLAGTSAVYSTLFVCLSLRPNLDPLGCFAFQGFPLCTSARLLPGDCLSAVLTTLRLCSGSELACLKHFNRLRQRMSFNASSAPPPL